jgi:uroporphyrinogen decarboxylase
MRQAGRYQASYRAVREKVSFLELCRSPELVAQVTVAPIDEFGFDAAIIFSDILIALPAMGLDLSFEKGEKGKGDGGPKIANAVRTRADAEALKLPEPDRDLKFVAESIRATKAALKGRVPLIGFCGGPFTVASYAVEGKGGAYDRVKQLMYCDPDAADVLFDKLADAAILQLSSQVAAGVDAVQVFESWLGELCWEDLARFVLPRLMRISEKIPRVPKILYSNGTGAYLEALAACGFDVISVDWRIPIHEARRRLSGHAVQGNLDPVLLLGPEETLLDRARAMLEAAGSAPGYIFNLGHGILPGTPPENVRALVRLVQGA